MYCKYRLGNSKLPVLALLHGFPQNHTMWDSFMKHLPHEWPLLVPDLPGYGDSAKDPSPDDASAYTKASWSTDVLELADAVFPADAYVGELEQRREHVKLIVFGHDRGARLAYRMALNSDRVVGLAVLDIVPTSFVWAGMNISDLHAETHGSHHWIFLASPRPIPEKMIFKDPEFYFGSLMNAWMGTKARTDPNAKWVRDSLQPYLDEDKTKVMARITAACEDYRAGATLDVKDDLAAGIVPTELDKQYQPKVAFNLPTLVMASAHLRRRFPVDDIWQSFCAPETCNCYTIGDETVGHFFVNEAQEETLQRSLAWLNKWWKH
ncbi:alpha/beta-hydrolase [Exidia glandulosa HHB12029]|uniref:Alpha/beta-hydrolase n=1 Tax=Exidia glandulosa HHB12029 TaxID=1314781 RepID=A0A166AY46_EXIGL|nr:alpha/beta-hydrolase [Exidia glandulosa HHB12029]